MIKINLDQKILNVKGEPIKNTVANPKYEALSEKEKGRTKIPPTIEKEATVRDYLLTILGVRFEIKDKNKEQFWTTDLGILFSKDENKIVEISPEQAEFLKRIITENKAKQQMPMGQSREIEIFFPYELGQLLKLFKPSEEKPKEKKKE
jgi:hypothetical protein